MYLSIEKKRISSEHLRQIYNIENLDQIKTRLKKERKTRKWVWL